MCILLVYYIYNYYRLTQLTVRETEFLRKKKFQNNTAYGTITGRRVCVCVFVCVCVRALLFYLDIPLKFLQVDGLALLITQE